MTIIHENIEVKIKEITSCTQVKSFFGSMNIKGICEGTIEDGESFEFNFNYEGKPNEDKNLIMDSLKRMAEQIYIKKRREATRTTLNDLVTELM